MDLRALHSLRRSLKDALRLDQGVAAINGDEWEMEGNEAEMNEGKKGERRGKGKVSERARVLKEMEGGGGGLAGR